MYTLTLWVKFTDLYLKDAIGLTHKPINFEQSLQALSRVVVFVLFGESNVLFTGV
jgi:hypothetical protein